MNAAKFKQWRKLLKLTQAEAATALDMHPNSISEYERGLKPVPKTVALACAAIAHGLGPWGE